MLKLLETVYQPHVGFTEYLLTGASTRLDLFLGVLDVSQGLPWHEECATPHIMEKENLGILLQRMTNATKGALRGEIGFLACCHVLL